MRLSRQLLIALAVLALPAVGWSAKYKAPAAIVATLPPFCGAQYIDGLENDPRYQITGCGVYTNHYCPGLVHLARARKEKTKSERLEALKRAEVDMKYTLDGTGDYPGCFLRPLAEAKLKEIADLRRIYK